MTPRRGPGPVATVHRILIGAALACALVYGGWELREFVRHGAAGSALRAALAFVAGAGIGLYLRSLRGLGAKLTPRDDTVPPRRPAA
jgi:hypothetical protein